MKIPLLWGSECNGGEEECKNDFEEHHGARGRSNKLRYTERCREGEPGQRRAERDTALYSRDPGLSRKRGRGQTRSAMEKCRHGAPLVCQSGSSMTRTIRLNCPAFASRRSMIGYPPSEGKITLRVVQVMSYLSVHDLSVHTKQEGDFQDDSYEDNCGRNGTVPGLILGPSTKPR